MPRIRLKRAVRRRLLVATSSSPMGQELYDAVSINPEIAVPDAKREKMCYISKLPLPEQSGNSETLIVSAPFPAELRVRPFQAHPAPTADKVLYLSRTS